MAKPKYYDNAFGLFRGYPWAGTEAITAGTATEEAVDLGRNLSNGIKMAHVDATASRSMISLNSNCPGGVWCALLVEIVDFDLANYSGATQTNAPLKNSTTANLNADTSEADRIVSFDQIKAGGIGWYCIWFKYDVTTAAPTIRCGFGTDGLMTNGAGHITVGRVGFFELKQDNIEPSTTGNVPSFSLPSHPAAYAVTDNVVDANKKVTWGTTSIGTIDRYSVIYSIGDSKSNDKDSDAPTTLPEFQGIACYSYARTGQGLPYMLTNIADLQALKIDNVSEVKRDIWADMDEFPQIPLRPNCLMFCNFGVNDMNNLLATGDEEVAGFISLSNTLGYADVIMTEINPWGSGTLAGSAPEIAETKLFNAAIKQACRDNGWVFVPIYYATSNQPTNPDDLLPAYFITDGLHMIKDGSTVVCGLIRGAIDEFNQRGHS